MEVLENTNPINDSSQLSTTGETEKSLVTLKNELLNLLLLLEQEFLRTEDGNIIRKEETIKNQPPHLNKVTSQNERFLEQLGNIFELLQEIMELSINPTGKQKTNTICFLGNTGSGKSTLMQLLAADNAKIYSKEVSKDHFIIVDESKIGTNTVISETLYPELLIDNESQYILCDNPGFEDTRSSIHEIIAMSVMKKILQHMNKLKTVLVCPQASLIKGGNRNDFTNLLKHLTGFINNVPKFGKSIYLIGTKVDNSFVKKIGKLEIISDESVIDGITMFLLEVKSTFSNENNRKNVLELQDKNFYENCIHIIDSLLERSDSITYDHINIFRRPMEEGCLSDICEFQTERNKIREMLLTDTNFIEIEDGDFCTALTDTALRFLNTILKIMNTYITDLSEIMSADIIKCYEMQIKDRFNFCQVMEILTEFKDKVMNFQESVEQSNNPKEYHELISKFLEENNLPSGGLAGFKKVCVLYDFLTDLENKSDSSPFSPLSWSASMKQVSVFLNTKFNEYNFLKEAFLSLSSYKMQRVRKTFLFFDKYKRQEREISQKDMEEFFQLINVQNFSVIKSGDILNELKKLVNIALEHDLKFYEIDEDTLLVVDYFILISELNINVCKKYSSINKLILFAMHTIFIDDNMTNEWFKGKHITIIAPTWEVNGSRMINIDGMERETLPKAEVGQIGEDGANGYPGGVFLGVGMVFNDSQNLKISACGGPGQNGQEGGDGENGADGENGITVNEGKIMQSSAITTGIYNHHDETLEYRGSPGKPGSDSGEGGKGGKGGKKGSITIHDVGETGHEILTLVEEGKYGIAGKDGIPGEGGKHGKTMREDKTGQSLFYILMHSVIKTKEKDCAEKAINGKVKRKIQGNARESIEVSLQPQSVIENGNGAGDPKQELALISNNLHLFMDYLCKDYNFFLTDGITEIFFSNTQKYLRKSLGMVQKLP